MGACRRLARIQSAALNEPAFADRSTRMLATRAPRAALLVRVALGAVFLSEGRGT